VSDILTSFANLLDGSFLQTGALWALNTIPGFPPIIQTTHLLAIAVVMGSAVLLNLRILGLAVPSQGLSEMTNRVMPWLWWALPVNLISGAFFVFGRPNRYFSNPVFTSKMGFLIVAIALTLVFYLLHRRQQGYWEQPGKKWPARILALASLGLWIMVVMSGRWIAYLEYLQYPLWSFEVYDAGPQDSFFLAVENWSLSQIIASTNWFPLLESFHVIAATLVVGSILWVDLRLLGLAGTRYAFTTLNRELVPWTWGAFAVATVTGVGMFITRADSHLGNPAFQWKLVLLALAGVNMAYFHFKVYQHIEQWDRTTTTPWQLKLAGCLSLLLWSGVMLAGRWVGHIV
jgi:hypothetical protein